MLVWNNRCSQQCSRLAVQIQDLYSIQLYSIEAEEQYVLELARKASGVIR